jgi:CHAD domain-containing protein
MTAKALRKRWRQTLAANQARVRHLLRRHGPLNDRAIHDLRVALRRARLLLQLRSKTRDRERTKRIRATAHKIMAALAPVRDADVVLEWARAGNASPRLLAHLLHDRTELGRRAERKLARLNRNSRLPRLMPPRRCDADKLARRFKRWQAAMSTRCITRAAKAAELTTPELHALRRDIRRWRYLLELTANPKQPRRSPKVQALIAAQEALGAIQNLEVVLAGLNRCGRSKECTTLRRKAGLELAVNRRAALRELERLTEHLDSR